ncbi:MAG: exodeoxyribonuclease V subunit alpha [Spirochaetia bacterium]|nr:exodeoxyribonuclease V subunit alpha [Spirochaetia bacterium]
MKTVEWFSEAPEDGEYFAHAILVPELAFWMHAAQDIESFSTGQVPSPLRRLVLILGYSCTYGDLCIELTPARIAHAESKLRKLLERPMPGLDAIIKFACSPNFETELPGIVSRTIDAPLVLASDAGHSFLYFQKHFVSRRSVIRNFQLLTKTRPESWNIEQAIVAFKAGVSDRFNLAGEQRQAIALALYSSLAIVTGGPGTGKTTVIVGILRALVSLGIQAREIRIATPTGRAARRVKQAIDGSMDRTLSEIETGTLHSLLGFSRHRGDFKYSAQAQIPYKAIILDEVSMVDLNIMSRLLESISPGKTRLILLGDRDQLPSVESGAVLGDMVELLLPESQSPGYSNGFLEFCNSLDKLKVAKGSKEEQIVQLPQMLTDSIVELKSSHRSGESIRTAALEINQGRMPAWSKQIDLQSEGCGYFEIQNEVEFQALMARWAGLFFDPAYLNSVQKAIELNSDSSEARSISEALLAHVTSYRILSFTRHGDRGTRRINALLKQHAYDLGLPFEGDMHAGMPLMVVQNDYRRRIFNGETGVLLQFRNGFRWMFIEGDRMVSLTPAALPQWEAAHAITVHKSQGSEYDHVLMVMPSESDHPILSRQILYTGLTRAKKGVIVAGSLESIQAALTQRIKRETGGLKIDQEV